MKKNILSILLTLTVITINNIAFSEVTQLDTDAYTKNLELKIKSKWTPPQVEERTPQAVFMLQIMRDGSLANSIITTSSNNKVYDDACSKAISTAAPFSPLPKEYTKPYVKIEFICSIQNQHQDKTSQNPEPIGSRVGNMVNTPAFKHFLAMGKPEAELILWGSLYQENQNDPNILKYLKDCSEKQFPVCQILLTEHYLQSEKLDSNKAVTLLTLAMQTDPESTKKKLEDFIKSVLYVEQLSAEEEERITEMTMPAYNWAYFYLKVLQQTGGGSTQDYPFEWYQKAADQGLEMAQNDLAFRYENGLGTLMDKKKAFEYYQKAAEQGFALSQNNLGTMYENGIGIPVDVNKAFENYQKAAEQDLSLGQYNLGRCYYSGIGTTVDYKTAREFFEKAADAHEANSENYIGVMYLHGEGLLKDYNKAMQWFLRASKDGSVHADLNIGIMYTNGRGVPKDNKKAFTWYLKAADLGNARSEYIVGIMYRDGIGVQKDVNKGNKYIKRALEHGFNPTEKGDDYSPEVA